MGKNRKALKKAEDTVVNDAQAAGQNVLDDAADGAFFRYDLYDLRIVYDLNTVFKHRSFERFRHVFRRQGPGGRGAGTRIVVGFVSGVFAVFV